MGRAVRATLALVLAAAAIAVGALLVLRSGSPPVPAAGAVVRVPAAVAVRSGGGSVVSAEGEQLALHVPVRTDAAVAVVLEPPADLPAGMSAESGALSVSPGRTAMLVLAWDGPDCARDVPDRVLPDLTLSVRVPGGAGPVGSGR